MMLVAVSMDIEGAFVLSAPQEETMKQSLLGPDAVTWLGVQYRTILTSAATDGRISVIESVSPPDTGPPRHVHHDADETFVLLSGDCDFWLDGEVVTRGPGQTVFVPCGTEHSFRVVSRVPARHLVILTPGGFEGFFADMAEGGFRIPEDMTDISRIADRYHLTFTGPPMGHEGGEVIQ
jgi:mannose-6-phosphate isomerase-like protein (cupin superfamily)